MVATRNFQIIYVFTSWWSSDKCALSTQILRAMKSSSSLVAGPFLVVRDYLDLLKVIFVLSMVNHYEIIIWGISCSVKSLILYKQNQQISGLL